MTFETAAWIFICYAFLGWCSEVSFAALKNGRFVPRGFLSGPVCPIYGVGMLLVSVCLEPLTENLILLFICSVLLTTAIEFLTGFILEKFFKDKWWDYSKEPFNIKGYICLRFSLLWGFGCVFIMRIIHPSVLAVIGFLSKWTGVFLIGGFYALFIADLVLTIITLAHLHKQVRILGILEKYLKEFSDKVGEPIANTSLKIRKKVYNKEKLDALKEKFKTYSEKKNIFRNRLIKTYPRFGNGRYHELSERIKQLFVSDKNTENIDSIAKSDKETIRNTSND